jgi:hypothetical protein
MKTNKDGTPRKQGSGRKKGAISFTYVSFAQLEDICGTKTMIPVSRVWLENLGVTVETEKQEKITIASLAPKSVEPEQKIEFVLHR